MQRSLKPQSTGQHRGDPPAFARRISAGEGCRAEALKSEGGHYLRQQGGGLRLGNPWSRAEI